MLLVLCVDLDDDLGRKTGFETPVTGRDAVEDELGIERSSPTDPVWYNDAYDELFERNERAMAALLADLIVIGQRRLDRRDGVVSVKFHELAVEDLVGERSDPLRQSPFDVFHRGLSVIVDLLAIVGDAGLGPPRGIMGGDGPSFLL